ncbi:MAG: hypothetical protein ACOX1I_02340 [Dethiobacteria bacterium]
MLMGERRYNMDYMALPFSFIYTPVIIITINVELGDTEQDD